MHLPRSSPALRGMRLWLVAWLAGLPYFGDVVLRHLRADARLDELPERL